MHLASVPMKADLAGTFLLCGDGSPCYQAQPALTGVPSGQCCGAVLLFQVSTNTSLVFPLLHFKVRLSSLQFSGKLSKGENSANCLAADK